jgi:hypothetical protein
MTDFEKLVAKGTNAVCVETITTTRSFYNCFGDKIDETVTEKSRVYTFLDGTWVLGLKENKE